jgi:hypothetical protein
VVSSGSLRQQLGQLEDARLLRHDGVMVLKLLALQLLAQRGVLLLELAEAADIGPVGGPHEMGEHMHFAEDAADQGVAGKGMGQQGPIGRRNVAALACLDP